MLFERRNPLPIYDAIPHGAFCLTAVGVAYLSAVDTDKSPWPLPPLPATSIAGADPTVHFPWRSGPEIAQTVTAGFQDVHPLGSSGNPIITDDSFTFTSRDFPRVFDPPYSSGRERDKTLWYQASGFLTLVKGQTGLDQKVLGAEGNIKGTFVQANVRGLIADHKTHSLVFLSASALIFTLNLRYSMEYAVDMSSVGGFHLLHVANSMANPTQFSEFMNIEHLRRTWEIWAVCYDCLVSLKPFMAIVLTSFERNDLPGHTQQCRHSLLRHPLRVAAGQFNHV